MERKKKAGAPRPGILLIAPVGSGRSSTNAVGGNKVMADEQTKQFTERGFGVAAIDTSGGVTNLPRWRILANRLGRFLRVIRGTAWRVWRADVVFLIIRPHSANGLASFLWVISTLAGKPFVLRLTGSGLLPCYRGYGRLGRWLADRTWMRAALVYVETEALWQHFNSRGNYRWFPNTRDVEPWAADRRNTHSVKRLIFASRLEMSKGLAEAIAACQNLPEDLHLDVFGPGTSDTDFSLFDNNVRATYRGTVEPGEVPKAFIEHDLLLHPSYCRNEGYPGVILEAFQCGLPVVAADWGAVAELVQHEESGLIVEPRSATAVESAIRRLLDDPELYRQLCQGAQRRGEQFRSSNWYDDVASELHDLCRK